MEITKEQIKKLETVIGKKSVLFAGGQKNNGGTISLLSIAIKSLIFKRYGIEQYSDLSSDELKDAVGFVDYLSALDMV